MKKDGAKEKPVVSMAIPENYQLSYSSNLWIADTRDTIHNAPHGLGLE